MRRMFVENFLCRPAPRKRQAQLTPSPTVRRVFAAGAFVFLAAFGLHAADLRLVGTDLLGLEFTKALYAAAGEEGITLSVVLDGSRPGHEQLKSGRADLALLILSPGDEPDK